MFELLKLKPEAFGLDISDLSIKIVNLNKRKNKFSLSCFGEMPVKPGIVSGGEIQEEKELVKIIKTAVAKVTGEKIRTKYVVASLPEEKAFLQVIQMPRLSEDDLKSAIVYEAENYIPLPIEKVYLDFQKVVPLQNHLDHSDILIAALPKQTIDPYVSCLKAAGLKPVALEIESLSIARALVKDELAVSPCLLIDFGATRTSFIIFSGSCLRFTSSVPVSATTFTETIAKKMNISLEDAEDLKIQYGLDSGSKEGSKVFEALLPVLTELVDQTEKHLRYYHDHASHEHLGSTDQMVKKIFICGGGANLKNIVGFLSGQLNIAVEIGNPWINIPHFGDKKFKISPEQSLKFATAIGLALRGINPKSLC